MSKRIDLFDSTYSHFTEQVLDAIRKETFGQDIGQNSWPTVDEYDRFIHELTLAPEDHVLEVASGSGGPALYLANQVSCYVTGIDANESGIAMVTESAVKSNNAKTRLTTLDQRTLNRGANNITNLKHLSASDAFDSHRKSDILIVLN